MASNQLPAGEVLLILCLMVLNSVRYRCMLHADRLQRMQMCGYWNSQMQHHLHNAPHLLTLQTTALPEQAKSFGCKGHAPHLISNKQANARNAEDISKSRL